jgi:hypothetical protein
MLLNNNDDDVDDHHKFAPLLVPRRKHLKDGMVEKEPNELADNDGQRESQRDGSHNNNDDDQRSRCEWRRSMQSCVISSGIHRGSSNSDVFIPFQNEFEKTVLACRLVRAPRLSSGGWPTPHDLWRGSFDQILPTASALSRATVLSLV